MRVWTLIVVIWGLVGSNWARADQWPEDSWMALEPRTVASGNGFLCLLDREGVKCVGDGVAYWRSASNKVRLNPFWADQTKTPAVLVDLKSPQRLWAGDDSACALDAEGLKCWGLGTWVNRVPLSARPERIYFGDRTYCLQSTRHFVCDFGSNR